MTTTVDVRSDDGTSYPVAIGSGLWTSAPSALSGASAVLVVHPAVLAEPARRLAEAWRAGLGGSVHLVGVPDGEEAKRLAVAERVYAAAAGVPLGRDGAVVGFGGGAVTDLAGFVAATWLRGVPVVQVPTTLLAMVDAAVGGKNALDLTAGKNLIGTYHQPAAVICDLTFLDSLPTAEFRSGLAEVAKCGLVCDPDIVTLLEEDPTGRTRLDQLVGRSVRAKAAVVGEDTFDGALRETLNYGHTLGHAIEALEGGRWRHGEAVAVGMMFAAELAAAAGQGPAELVDRQRSLLTAIGLPTTYPGGRWDDLLELMHRDKKARAGALRFVILAELGRPTILRDPPVELLQVAWEKVSR